MNLTQLSGIVVFALAGLLAWRVARRGAGKRKTWLALAFIYVCFVLELIFELRFTASTTLAGLFHDQGAYSLRHGVQAIIVLTLLCGAVVWFLFSKIIRKSKAKEQVLAIASVFLTFVLEIVSWHSFDAMLYLSLGPILFIGWIWVSAAMVSIIGSCIRLLS